MKDSLTRSTALTRLLASFLKIFFNLLYHQFSWSYDLVAATVSLGMWKAWVMAALPYLQGPTVLEIGHGPGHLQVALHKKGLPAVGVDASHWMGLQAFRRLKSLGFVPLLVNGYAQFLPFKPNSFHQVIATFPTEYIIDPLTLANIFQVLKPGGQLLVIPVAWITARRLPHRLAAWLFRSTGQAPDWEDQSLLPYSQAGFEVHQQRIDLATSHLILIIASKPGDPPYQG